MRQTILFETHNDRDIEINGTHLQGYVDASFDTLVNVFGKPTVGDEYKTDWEWAVEFDDGTVATVYNWKNGPNYCGSTGLNKHQVNDWHVGGFSRDAVDNVLEALFDTTPNI